ncbi:receptor-like kinase TMK4 [Chenopodium quinoa]|uniref:non-specific serine/threonine protein kinase n=1 Tax=Chenopodium quinoa TaxID=63459 RepID=A0A803LZJ6_CHEQI|nr:receptor-like kinase TMK4 [Chenopodium quinoa]
MKQMDVPEYYISLSLILLFAFVSFSAQDLNYTDPLPSFKCVTNNATCEALVGYVSQNTTTFGHIQSLFQVKDLSSLLGVNLYPPSTHEDYIIGVNQTVKVPIPCRCINGTGLSDRIPIYTVAPNDTAYSIGTYIFSGLVANGSNPELPGLVSYQQIIAANPIMDFLNLTIGTKLWIPLPCSCDTVVHYAHVMPPGSTLDQVAAEFNITSETLASVNNITDPSKVKADQVIDVPLKGSVLQNLATPSAADGAVLKKLISTLSPVSGWYGSNFCIWSGIICTSNGFVKSISLPSRNISGSLSPDLNSLSQLTTIYLQNNQLSGPLPSFANLKSLREIHLDSNNFTLVPNGIFSGLNLLRILSLNNNPHLSPWAFPAELTDSRILVSFQASNASLMGPIPDIFDSLTSFQNLRLSYNNLTGSLPGSLYKTQMQNLWLENQHMGLSGSLDVLAEMRLLKQVWLQGNKFTGPIPDLSNNTGIFDLQLQNNLLTGVVPNSLMSLPGLVNISLQNNKLQGPLPAFPDSTDVTLGTTNLFCQDVQGACDFQVTTLLEVAGALGYPLKLAEAWQGNDACNKWPYVTCDASGNIIRVNLSKQGFSGTISPALANLTSLSELYFDNNNLTGTIPASLTTLHSLKEINLSNNDLRGEIPNFKSTVIALTYGNKNIGNNTNNSTVSASKKTPKKTSKILLAALALTFSIVSFWVMLYVLKKRRHNAKQKEDAEQWEGFLHLAPDSPLRFSYHALKTATDNFNVLRKLGGGGFGTVFEGNLNNTTKIAVKRLDCLGQGRKEFLAEVQTIGSIHHVNLVKLVGFCAEKVHNLLVYEHMSNGSLDKWIFKTNSRDALPWDTKRKIILHIAKGLAYLHEDCQKRIAHLDVKPQNVLLDQEFNAKLSDFGLAKLMDKDQSYVLTQMRGTRGYLAPEWLGRKITEKVDVYSYGVVVLEVIFERKNLDCSEESTLIMQVKTKIEENKLLDLLDKCSEDMHQNFEDIEMAVKLAIWCLQIEPARRPSMSTVVKVLEGSVFLENIDDFSLTSPVTYGNPTLEPITEISDSVLSGPR